MRSDGSKLVRSWGEADGLVGSGQTALSRPTANGLFIFVLKIASPAEPRVFELLISRGKLSDALNRDSMKGFHKWSNSFTVSEKRLLMPLKV